MEHHTSSHISKVKTGGKKQVQKRVHQLLHIKALLVNILN